MQLFKTPNIDFVSKRRGAYVFSGALLLIGIVFLVINGGLNLGIDFKGGTELVFKFEDEITTNQLRNVMAGAGLGNSQIRHFGMSNEFLIYVEQQEAGSVVEIENEVKKALEEQLDTSFVLRKADNVGPKVGEELRSAAIMAIAFALLIILVYISWRFELIFALGAIAALFHDVLITLGIYNSLNFEISLKEIAAFLTIVGYSLNDTIVLYDRIRENFKVMRSDDLKTIINKSINQVLSRTVITSLTTFFVIFILFLFGGEVIRGFSFAMLIGVLVGTFSSVFVASSLILDWQLKHGGKQGLKMSKKKKRSRRR